MAKNDEELTHQLAKLLASASGVRQLEKLLGAEATEKLNLPKHEPARPRTERGKILPDYALHVEHVCLLCDHEWTELFHMKYSVDLRCHKSVKFPPPGAGRTVNVQQSHVNVTERTDVTELYSGDCSVEEFKKMERTTTYPLRSSQTQHQTCRLCSVRLSVLPVETLVGKLIRRATRIGETEDAVSVLTRLTERRKEREAEETGKQLKKENNGNEREANE